MAKQSVAEISPSQILQVSIGSNILSLAALAFVFFSDTPFSSPVSAARLHDRASSSYDYDYPSYESQVAHSYGRSGMRRVLRARTLAQGAARLVDRDGAALARPAPVLLATAFCTAHPARPTNSALCATGLGAGLAAKQRSAAPGRRDRMKRVHPCCPVRCWGRALR